MGLAMHKYRFIGGLLLALISAIMYFLDLVENPGRIAIGIVGIVLIATSKGKMHEKNKNN